MPTPSLPDIKHPGHVVNRQTPWSWPTDDPSLLDGYIYDPHDVRMIPWSHVVVVSAGRGLKIDEVPGGILESLIVQRHPRMLERWLTRFPESAVQIHRAWSPDRLMVACDHVPSYHAWMAAGISDGGIRRHLTDDNGKCIAHVIHDMTHGACPGLQVCLGAAFHDPSWIPWMKSHGYDINGTIPAGSDEEHIGSMAVYMKDEALLKTWFQHGGDPMKQVRGQTLVEDIVGHGSLTMFEAWLDHVGPDRMLHAPTVSGSSVGRLAMLQDVRMAQAWIIRGGCMLAEDHRDVTNALLYGLASTSWDQHPALIMTKQALITALDHDTPSLELMTQAWSHPVARQIAEQSIAHMPDPLDMARWIQSCDIARRRCVRDVDGHLT